MSPARTAVVRNVLVEMLGEVGFAVDVVPVPVLGNVFLEEVAEWRRVGALLARDVSEGALDTLLTHDMHDK